jgi:hypothetical protein
MTSAARHAFVLIVAGLGAAACQRLTYDGIAHGKLGFGAPGDVLSTGTISAINEAGMVVFPALDALGQPCIFAGDGMSLTELGLGSMGLAMPDAIGIDSAAEVVFTSSHLNQDQTHAFGVYTTTLTAAAPTTLVENTQSSADPEKAHGLGLSANGTVATSTVISGHGSVLRGPVAGPLTALDDGSLTFNTGGVAVNDAGVVAIQAEHWDPIVLVRAILLFSASGQTLAQTYAAVDQLNVGEQPSASINASGDVAFALNRDVTLYFADPPLTGTNVVGQQTVTPGVYISHPTLAGTPLDLTQVANLADGFASFGRVLISDAGLVVFEATLANGTGGIFHGRNPAIDAIAVENNNSSSGPGPLQSLTLGGLNNHGQAVFHGVNANNGIDEFWRVGGL